MTSLTGELFASGGPGFCGGRAFRTFGLVQVSDRPDLAQYQCNGALAAAKAAKANPRAIAEKIAARLKAEAIFAKVEIAGPGFLNLDLRDDALNARVAVLAGRPFAAATNGETGDDRFRRAEYRQADGGAPSAHHHYRRLPAASVPRQWLAGDQRCASGRLGLPDGSADYRDRDRGHRAGLFRYQFHRAVPRRGARQPGRSGNHLSARLGGLQGRSRPGWKRRAAPPWSCKRGARAIAPCGGSL